MSYKIAVSNTKGGIGKTSTAICLANGLAKKGKKVLIVDADPNSISTTGVFKAKINDEYTLTDVLYANENLMHCVQHTEIGDIVPCDKQLKQADTLIPADTERFFHLSDNSEEADKEYDYIIFDCPPGEGVILGNILSFVNSIIIPITCDAFGIECLSDFEGILAAHKKRINPKLSILGVLITMYEGNQSLTKGLEANVIPVEVRKLNTSLFNTKIRRSVKIKESQIAGIPLFDYAPSAPITEDYMKFVEEVINRCESNNLENKFKKLMDED